MREGYAPHARPYFESESAKEAGGKIVNGKSQAEATQEKSGKAAVGEGRGALNSGKTAALDEAMDQGTNFEEKARIFWVQKNEANRSTTAGAKLGFHPEVLGTDTMEFSDEEWESAAAEWTWALVGLVFGAKPSLGKMTGYVRTRWGDESVVSVGQLDQGIFIFSFASEQARDRVVDSGPWTFDNRPLVLKHWSPDETYSLNSVESLPVWVRFPRLGVHLRREDLLSRIASMVGHPIRTDGFTKGKQKLEYARVLVEVFASNELKRSVILKGPNGVSFVQRVEYDWVPSRCEHCQSFGHKVQHCKLPRIEICADNEVDERVIVEPPIDQAAGDASRVVIDSCEGSEEGEIGSLVSEVPETVLANSKENQGEEADSKEGLMGSQLQWCQEDGEPFVEIVKKRKKKKNRGRKDGCSQDSDMNINLRTLARRSKGNGIGAKISLL